MPEHVRVEVDDGDAVRLRCTRCGASHDVPAGATVQGAAGPFLAAHGHGTGADDDPSG